MDGQFNSVFDNAVEVEKDFDNMFGAQEDDELMGIVLGESGESDDMETLDDGITPKELKDELDTGDCEKPTADSDGEFDIEDKEGGLGDLDCPKTGVEDAVQKTSPDETNLEDEIDKAENKVDLEESMNLDKLYESDEEEVDDTAADVETGDEETSATNVNAAAELDKLYESDDEPVDVADEEPSAPAGDGVDPEEIDDDDDDDDDVDFESIEDCGDVDCEKCDKTDIAPSIPDGNAEVVAVDTDSDVDDDDDDDDGFCEAVDTIHFTETTDGEGEAPADDLKEPETADKAEGETEACGESLDNLYEADDESEEAMEDEIIADVEDDSELSDAEVNELLDDDDDDIIDDVLNS